MPKERRCNSCLSQFISFYNRAYCLNCKKSSSKCPHGTKKGRCKIDGCFGNEICEHKEHNQKCSICKPGVKDADKLNASIRNLMKGKNIRIKTKEFILSLTSAKDLSLLINYFKQNLIEEYLSVDECQLDHIKPKFQFNLNNYQELLECCHYKNLRFISEKANLSKGCKYIKNNL